MPKDLQPVYANVAFISHAPAEMVIEFALVLPRSPTGRTGPRDYDTNARQDAADGADSKSGKL